MEIEISYGEGWRKGPGGRGPPAPRAPGPRGPGAVRPRGGRGAPAAPAIKVKALPAGMVPKRLIWQPLPKVKVKDTMFVDFDLNKDDDTATDVDFGLLSEMFCRREEEIKAE